MNYRLLGSLPALLAGSALCWAGPCACDCCTPPASPLPSFTLFHQEQPPPPTCGPTTALPPPGIFRATVQPPVCTPAPPLPPVRLFHCPPPPAPVFTLAPPGVPLFRQEPLPPKWTKAPPLLPVALFRQEATCPRPLPDYAQPSFTLFRQPQPPCPVCGDGP